MSARFGRWRPREDAGGAIRTRRCGSRSGIFPAAGRLRSHRTPDRGRGAGHRVEIAALEAFRVFLHNGNSQACVNLLEGSTLHDFHVHRATERYRWVGRCREDGFAVPTKAFFDDPGGGVRCAAEEANLGLPGEVLNTVEGRAEHEPR